MRGMSVLVVDADDAVLTARGVNDVLSAAFEGGAHTVAVAVDRLDPAFFELRSGVAGEIVQKFVNYGMRLVVVGALPEEALESRSFSGFVVEGNRGRGPWFVASLDELAARLATAG